MQWIVGSILHGGPIELFLVPAYAPQLVKLRQWYVPFYLWDDAHKRSLAAKITDWAIHFVAVMAMIKYQLKK